jgi:acyl-coenzyme A thioesterase PaaI-like protein
MLFSQTLASIQPQDKGWSAIVGEDWSQGRATFGGMVAALGNEAMRRLVPADRKLRGLETVFAGPALAGAVRIEAEVLRVGNAVTIASARVWSADKIAATLTGTYGIARSTAMSASPTAAVGVPAVQNLPEKTTGAGGAPAFAQHFDLRWAEGAWPFSGSSLNRSKIGDSANAEHARAVELADLDTAISQARLRICPRRVVAHRCRGRFGRRRVLLRVLRRARSQRRPRGAQPSNGGGVWLIV